MKPKSYLLLSYERMLSDLMNANLDRSQLHKALTRLLNDVVEGFKLPCELKVLIVIGELYGAVYVDTYEDERSNYETIMNLLVDKVSYEERDMSNMSEELKNWVQGREVSTKWAGSFDVMEKTRLFDTAAYRTFALWLNTFDKEVFDGRELLLAAAVWNEVERIKTFYSITSDTTEEAPHFDDDEREHGAVFDKLVKSGIVEGDKRAWLYMAGETAGISPDLPPINWKCQKGDALLFMIKYFEPTDKKGMYKTIVHWNTFKGKLSTEASARKAVSKANKKDGIKDSRLKDILEN